jgi:alanine or glycine:cation symporter, AGCS family
MLETIEHLSGEFVGLVWGLPMIFMLFGAGLFFTIYFRFPQIRFFKHAIDIVRGHYDKPEDKGEISHFQALCAALSATIGLGNIAGVAVAVSTGGPGAIFWMWVAGFVGMTTKFTEVSLATMYRDVDKDGHVYGGPMYTMKNALGKNWMWMASFYAFCIILSSFGAGNMFQSNQMASILLANTGLPKLFSGFIFAGLTWLVLVGGIKRIGKVAEKLVPAMVALYFLGAFGILIVNIADVPGMFAMILESAFNGTAAVGGFAGIMVKEVVIQGVRRAVFSNEAGMGSAAIAHSAAKSTPIQEGLVALLEPFIDTIMVCSCTAVVLMVTESWFVTGVQGSEMTAHAFGTLYGAFGHGLIALTVTLFAFSTIISWSYYGELGVRYLFKSPKAVVIYKYIFIAFIVLGAIAELKVVLNISDALFGLLAFPNLLTCVILAKKLKVELNQYEADLKSGKIKKTI